MRESVKDLRKTVIGNLIYNRRTQLGMTQFEVAKALGYKHGNFIGMLEKGQSYFPVDKWQDYARVLQVKEAEFLKVVLEEVYPNMLPYFKF